MSESALDRPVILTGMPRSGTTMLNEIAKRFLDISSINEGTFEFWLARRSHLEPSFADPAALRAVLARLAGHLYFHILFKGPPPVSEVVEALHAHLDEPTIPGIARAVLVYTREHCGGRLLGHEDPALIDDPEAVLRIFPGCRIVHILRDPRDAAASILGFPWGANNVYTYAAAWARKVAALRRIGRRIGPARYFEFRYQDVLKFPERVMRDLMLFVHGGVDADRVSAFVRWMEENPRRGNFGKWRRTLTANDIRLVEGAAWDEMVECGYEPAFPRRAVSPLEAGFWALHHRAVQARRVVAGRLAADGSAKPSLEPAYDEYHPVS